MSITTENVVVVGVDGTSSANTAALWAGAEAKLRRATLRLVQAYDVTLSFVGPGVMIPPTLYEDVQHAAELVLTKTRDAVLAVYPELEITTQLRRDLPFEALRKASEQALLTVVGSHRDSEFAASILGSVAQKVASQVGGPVVVVRTDPMTGLSHDNGPVVVGLDGSAESEHALSFGFEEASLRGVQLVAIHSWDNEPRVGLLGPYPHEVDRERFETEQRLLAEQLSGWSEKYPDVQVQSLILRGRPAATLMRHFEEAPNDHKPALMVVGSRGRGGFTGLLLGSTSNALIAHAQCPVAVVRAASDS